MLRPEEQSGATEEFDLFPRAEGAGKQMSVRCPAGEQQHGRGYDGEPPKADDAGTSRPWTVTIIIDEMFENLGDQQDVRHHHKSDRGTERLCWPRRRRTRDIFSPGVKLQKVRDLNLLDDPVHSGSLSGLRK